MGLGLSLFSYEQTRFRDLTLLWVYIAYTVFNVLHSATTFVVTKYYAKRMEKKEEGFTVEMNMYADSVDIVEKEKEVEEKVEKKDKNKGDFTVETTKDNDTVKIVEEEVKKEEEE